MFWVDYLTSLPGDPVQFALGYYARYPVINPLGYPPAFYLLEGMAFSLFGMSPFVAKSLVLAFAALAGLYLTAWLRRSLTPEAGWGGALFVLQPGMVTWSNAVMLNVPSLTCGVATLYHARCWLDDRKLRHLVLSVIFLTVGALTYVPTATVLFVILAWIVLDGRWRILRDWRVWTLWLVTALVAVPWLAVVSRWAPFYVDLALPLMPAAWRLDEWLFYLRALPLLLTIPVMVLAGAGLVAAVWDVQWRGEAKKIGVWLLVVYVVLALLPPKEPRYALLIPAAAVCLSIGGLSAIVRAVAPRVGASATLWHAVAVTALLAYHLVLAPAALVPRVHGLQEAAAFFATAAPREWVFYDGFNNGPFSFYVRANDPHRVRGVMVGHKLLSATATPRESGTHGYLASREEVVSALQVRCGCRWLAIERLPRPMLSPAAQYLREALAGPEFELVTSLPIESPHASHVDVYRFLLPVSGPKEVLLPFWILGRGRVYRATPLPPRAP